MDRASDGSASNDLPWASVFDPAANMRAFSAIQADGFRAASELVDRFVRMAAAGVNDLERAAGQTTAADQPSDVFGATGLEPVVNSWWSMVDQFMRVGSPRGAQPSTEPGSEPATLDLAQRQAMGRLRLESTAGGAATAEVWLHNSGPEDLGKVRLRCSDLLSHDGSVISADALHIDCDVVEMPGRSSRGVTVVVDSDVPPGRYRGTLLVDGHPDLWLPVELSVAALT